MVFVVSFDHFMTFRRTVRAGYPQAGFAQFPKKRLIAVGKFERHMKEHLFISQNSGFVSFGAIVMTLFGCICKYFAVFWPSPGGSMLETVLQAGPCRWLTGEGHLPAAAYTD